MIVCVTWRAWLGVGEEWGSWQVCKSGRGTVTAQGNVRITLNELH